MPSDHELMAQAHAARTRSICDISHYAVGAALLTKSGEMISGCNIENIVLGETVCAEKVALFKALEAGERSFTTVAVSTVSSPPASPCGSCRQMLMHWGVQRVISANDLGETVEWTMAELLPAHFVLEL